MSNEVQWHVQQGDQTLGPYSVSQMKEFAANGNIAPETMVWAQGLEEWIAASQVEGLFAQPQQAAAAPQMAAPAQQAAAAPKLVVARPQPITSPQAISASPQVAAQQQVASPAPQQAATPALQQTTSPTTQQHVTTPYQYGVTNPAANIDPTTPYPNVPVKKTKYGLWLTLFICGFSSYIIGMIILISSIGATAANINGGASEEEAAAGLLAGSAAGSILFMAGGIVNIIATILAYITLYRAWYCLQPGHLARTTPGKAIGFLFIPFFNIYWLFQAFKGLATDWNKTASSYNELQQAPRLSDGVFLTFCIGCFFPPLNVIMLFIVMSQMCKGINFFASRNQPASPNRPTGVVGATTQGGGGGLKIGGGFTTR